MTTKYEDLTEKQISYITNGCGGKSGIIVPPYAMMFKADCNHHDYGYWKGGGVWARFKADWQLAKAMAKDACKHKWRSPYFLGWSVGYFAGVRLAGFSFWHYTKTPRDASNIDWDLLYTLEEPNNVIDWENYEKTT